MNDFARRMAYINIVDKCIDAGLVKIEATRHFLQVVKAERFIKLISPDARFDILKIYRLMDECEDLLEERNLDATDRKFSEMQALVENIKRELEEHFPQLAN